MMIFEPFDFALKLRPGALEIELDYREWREYYLIRGGRVYEWIGEEMVWRQIDDYKCSFYPQVLWSIYADTTRYGFKGTMKLYNK